MAEPAVHRDSIARTIATAVVICAVCSIIVSVAAVALRPLQEENRRIDVQRNILSAAQLLPKDRVDAATVTQRFESVQLRLVDLRSGHFLSAEEAALALNGTSLQDYNPLVALRDLALSTTVPAVQDIARVRRREHYAPVYLAVDDTGANTLILPVRGYGLWSTLYGYLALAADANSIIGLSFYAHGETPGLGGEVDNPAWKAQWQGKKLYRPECLSGTERNCEVALLVSKGIGPAGNPHRVDGLSGASLTSLGVQNLVHYWLGNQGFSEFLANYRNGMAGS